MSKNSKYVNANKKKAKVNPQTKENIFTGLKTFISNDAVVSAGRNLKWWWPLIIALVSIVLALLPNFVSNMNADMGKNALGSSSYGYENGLVEFGHFLEDQKNDLTIKIENKELSVEGWEKALNNYSADAKWFTVPLKPASSTMQGDIQVGPKNAVGFEVFYNDTNKTDDEFRALVLENKNPYTEADRSATNPDGTEEGVYRTNVLILSKETFYFAKFPRIATASGAHFIGKYDHDSMQGKNLLEWFKLDDGVTRGSAMEAENVRADFVEFFRLSYESTKVGAVWGTTGIMFGVNFGVIVVFGFVIFLMTRGKNNPFRIVKWYEAVQMAGWASLSPAILSIPLGFFLTQYASFIFIFLYGIRLMWMSMRALRPYEPVK